MITAEVTISTEKLRNLRHPMQVVGIDWETYRRISEELGESSSLHLFYDRGSLTIMPVTEIHELLTSLLHNFITFAGMSLRLNVIPTGKATLRSEQLKYGIEPDLSFFVSKSDIHQTKNYVPTEIELAPDIVCEIDVYHPSDDKFETYSAFGISEFWQYGREKLKIFKLDKNGKYQEIERSEELPVLTSEILTEYLKRGQTEQQYRVLSDFQNWLNGELNK